MIFVPEYCILALGKRLDADIGEGIGFYKPSKIFLKKIGVKCHVLSAEKRAHAAMIMHILWNWRTHVKEYVGEPKVSKALIFCTDQLASNKIKKAKRCNRNYCPWCSNVHFEKIKRLLKVHKPVCLVNKLGKKGLPSPAMRRRHRLFVVRGVRPVYGAKGVPDGNLGIYELHFMADFHNIDKGRPNVLLPDEFTARIAEVISFRPELITGEKQYEYFSRSYRVNCVTVMKKYIKKRLEKQGKRIWKKPEKPEAMALPLVKALPFEFL